MNIDISKETILQGCVASGLFIYAIISIIILGYLNNPVTAIYSHYSKAFGPVFPALIILSALLLHYCIQLFFIWEKQAPSIRGILFVMWSGMLIGMYGTVDSLIRGLGNLKMIAEDSVMMIATMSETISIALWTTRAGLILVLLAGTIQYFVAPTILKWRGITSTQTSTKRQPAPKGGLKCDE